MNKTAIFLLALAVLGGCSGKDDGKSKDVMSLPVNSSLVEVTEVVGVGKVEPEAGIVSLAARDGGIVKEIIKNDGEMVSRGDAILSLDDELEQIKVMQLRTQYLAQSSQVEIDEANLAESEARLGNKERLLESVRSLAEKGAETTQVLDDLVTETEALRIATGRNRAAVELSRNMLEDIGMQLKYAIAQAERRVLRSPYEGILLEVNAMVGAALNQYSEYAEIAPSGRTIVKAEVDELFAGRLHPDLKAEIRHIGSDSTIATGTLYYVSPYLKRKSLFSGKSAEQEDRLVREVKIMLENNPGLILNSKVECVVKL